MITYIVLTTGEITKEEYTDLMVDKASKGKSQEVKDFDDGPPEAEVDVFIDVIETKGKDEIDTNINDTLLSGK